MKKLFIYLSMCTAFSLSADYTQLKQAVIKSNATQAKKLIATTTLSKEEISILAKLAHKVASDRRFDKYFAIAPGVLCASFSIHSSVLALLRICNRCVIDSEEIKRFFPFVLGANCFFATSFLYAAYKLLWSTRVWHKNAETIHQLLSAKDAISEKE